MYDPEDEGAQTLAVSALNSIVNDDGDAHSIYMELIETYGGDGLKIAINLWLANATHELGGPMPGELVTVEFADGTDMSEVERADPAAAWSARMLLAYLSQNEDLLQTLLAQLPKNEIVEWSYSLLELCAVNIRAKVINGEDITPKIQYIEIEDA